MSYTARRMKNSSKTQYFNFRIVRDDSPCFTLTAACEGKMIRQVDRGFFTSNDIIACQTFPQDYDFMDQRPGYVCGMSVPPVMMAQVAGEVARQIFDK